MARQRGLGPQGRTAVRRATQSWKELQSNQATAAPVHRSTTIQTNPAAITHEEPGELEAEAGLQWYDFDSSRVNQAAYDSKTKELFVNFVRPTPGQDEYVYEGVEPNEWRNFRRSASPGKFINRVLNYKDYHRIN